MPPGTPPNQKSINPIKNPKTMKAQAINHIRQHTEDGQNLSIQTIARYYYINETDGDQWELLEDSGILAIYKDNETEYIDIDHIIAITADK